MCHFFLSYVPILGEWLVMFWEDGVNRISKKKASVRVGREELSVVLWGGNTNGCRHVAGLNALLMECNLVDDLR
jgi:hypothetical protein